MPLKCRECGGETKINADQCAHCGARDPASGCLSATMFAAGFVGILAVLVFPRRLMPPTLTTWGYVMVLVGWFSATVSAMILGVSRKFRWALLPAGVSLVVSAASRAVFPSDPVAAIITVFSALLFAATAYAYGTTNRSR